MIKAVVFDLDDTLISEREYIRSGFRVVSKYFSNRYDLDESEVYKIMNELFEEASDKVFNRLFDSFNIKYSNEDILEFVKIYREHKPDIKFFDDVIPTINNLREKGIKVGIITDGYKETQRKKIEVLNCIKLFDEIIITDELGREFWKPHEKSYRIMAERLQVNLNELIYVGDNEEKDFIGANKLGIYTSCIIRANGIYSKKLLDIKYRAKKYIYKLNMLEEIIN